MEGLACQHASVDTIVADRPIVTPDQHETFHKTLARELGERRKAQGSAGKAVLPCPTIIPTFFVYFASFVVPLPSRQLIAQQPHFDRRRDALI